MTCHKAMTGRWLIVILLTLFLGAAHAIPGKNVSEKLHPLTRKLLAAQIHFGDGDVGLEGFDTYADSPGEKAFAAAIDTDGKVHAWGKA